MAAPTRTATSVAIATVRCSYSSIACRLYTVASMKIVPWRLAVKDYAYTGYVAYCCMFIMIFIDHFLAYMHIRESATLIRLRISLQNIITTSLMFTKCTKFTSFLYHLASGKYSLMDSCLVAGIPDQAC